MGTASLANYTLHAKELYSATLFVRKMLAVYLLKCYFQKSHIDFLWNFILPNHLWRILFMHYNIVIYYLLCFRLHVIGRVMQHVINCLLVKVSGIVSMSAGGLYHLKCNAEGSSYLCRYCQEINLLSDINNFCRLIDVHVRWGLRVLNKTNEKQ